MIKKLLKIVSTLLLVALCIAGVFFYSIFISVERLNVSYETISSTKIPTSMNNVKVAFITDLQYHHFMDKERFTSMIETINDAKPDVLIFGGDIFDIPTTYVPDDAIKQELVQLMSSIDAPLGKFAVLGEQDHADEATNLMVKDILYASDFELLTNSSIKIRNGNASEGVTLIGLDSLIGGEVNFDQAFANVDSTTFNLVAMHCPDTILEESFPIKSIDLAFAGHSHGAQLYIPLFGSLSSDEGAIKYNHGRHEIGTALLHVSNGIGTTTMDMRLFSPPQMLVYRLQSQSIPEPPVVEEPKTETPVEPTPDETTPPADTTETPTEPTE